MSTTKSLRHLVLPLSGACALLLGAVAACGMPQTPADGILRDLFTRQPIGHVDPETGDYYFDDGAVLRRDRISLVDSSEADRLLSQVNEGPSSPLEPVNVEGDAWIDWDEYIPVEEDDDSDECTSSCWYMVENTPNGQVGCKGCCINEGEGFCTCWEECWDISSESSSSGGSLPPPM